MATDFDVIVIGAGPAGYVAAIRCAQLGFNVACIDNWLDEQGALSLGGTCLNVGCIPSKALLQSSELFEQASHSFSQHGIKLSSLELDLETMMARKNKIVSELTSGIGALLKANKVKVITGTAKLLADKKVEVVNGKDKNTFSAKNIIIASGSSSVELNAAPLTEDLIVDSTGALSFESVPSKVGVIGAGVIGLELGSVWRRLGSEVTVLEAQDVFLPMVDLKIARDAQRLYKKQGLDIKLNARLLQAQIKTVNKIKQVEVSYQDETGDHLCEFDKLIVAVGRKPNTDYIFDDEAELILDERGFIHVNDKCETSQPGVYAIGDVVRGPMLAHKGSEEGMMVAELIAGNHGVINYDLIPSVIYTHPEIAWVGKTEQQLKAAGESYKAGMFPFVASGRAKAHGDTSGMVKILSHSETDRILGVHIMGLNASELISQAVTAMALGASTEDIALTVFAHPTLSEAIHEAALAVDNRAIHIVQKKP
ncbi:MAG: dihydrolipoyl dehydrogenase [Gammaproteobacteria bacterium]|nr:dihydrolipoyl dehydrogenase [Gammaproteobacteria bacterium]